MSSQCLISEQIEAAKPFSIGGLAVRNRCFLAPMSGVTDVPFRQLAWEFGAGLVVSEMVASEALTTGQEEMRLKAESAGLPVHVVQLAGRQPQWMREATKIAEGSGAHVIDINMGCPSKRVTTGYSGSALMRDLDHALTLIDAVVETTDLPVTLKMRLGWDEQSINAPELAERAQNAGVQMITVHGRTRNQFYKGEADWNKVAAVREKTTLPMVVNGDVDCIDRAREALSSSGADAVMIGRASYGAPWICGQVGAALDGRDVIARPHGRDFARLVARHYDAIIDLYGVQLGIRNARKHLDWYGQHLPAELDWTAQRREMMTSLNSGDVIKIIEDVFQSVAPEVPQESMAA